MSFPLRSSKIESGGERSGQDCRPTFPSLLTGEVTKFYPPKNRAGRDSFFLGILALSSDATKVCWVPLVQVPGHHRKVLSLGIELVLIRFCIVVFPPGGSVASLWGKVRCVTAQWPSLVGFCVVVVGGSVAVALGVRAGFL